MLLNTVTLWMSNLPAAESFYGGLLNLRVEKRVGKLLIHTGHSVLECIEADKSYIYHVAFTIPGNLFEDALEFVHKRTSLLWLNTYRSYVAEFTAWNARSFYFNDPAGNILEYIARHDLDEDTNGSFDGTQLTGVSEIGIVLSKENFDEEVNRFQQLVGVDNYEKQPPAPQFRVFGDAHGLFIVVPEGRCWFGDEAKLARPAPLRVEFTVQGKCKVWEYPSRAG